MKFPRSRIGEQTRLHLLIFDDPRRPLSHCKTVLVARAFWPAAWIT